MSWRESFDDDELRSIAAWLDRVLHDVVKYLEMMPRSLDWEALEEDDLEILHEAIFETRAGREGTKSALEVFDATLDGLPEPVRDRLPAVAWAREELEKLQAQGADLLSAPLEAIDLPLLRQRLFGVGESLRRMRQQLFEA